MSKSSRGVYLLKLDSNKYYCGSTDFLTKRILSHIHGYDFRGEKRFTAWTKKYPVKDIDYIWHTNFVNSKYIKIFEQVNGRQVSLERVFTLMAMEIYGINNIRGYCWTNTKADLNNYPQIKEMLTTDKATSMGMLGIDFIKKNPHLDLMDISMKDNCISTYFDACLKKYRAFNTQLATAS